MVKLQNEDGTWAGQHCITGRVAVTSAAILLLLADHDSVAVAANPEGTESLATFHRGDSAQPQLLRQTALPGAVTASIRPRACGE